MFQLRPYQEKVFNRVRQVAIEGFKKILMVLSTGAGKTAILFAIAKSAVNKGGKVLIIVHRRDLAFQTAEKFKEYGLDCGIIMSGVDSSLSEPIQIVSVWTYNRRLDLDEKEFNTFYVDASVVLVDEAHRSLSKVFQNVLGNYEDKIVIGVTATPCLSSGVGMGNMYETLIDVVPIGQLIEEKFLVPCVYYGGKTVDFKGIKTIRGDFDIKELGKRSMDVKLIGDVVDNWTRLASDRQTIVFAVNRKHGKYLRDSFSNRGVNTVYLDAFSSDEERDEKLNQFANGEVQVIVNVALFQEFLDAPITDCIVIARPTKALGLYRQMCGRALRPYPEKKETLILDHGGCVQRFGFIDDGVGWSLSGKELAWKIKTPRKKEKTLLTCEECGFIFQAAMVCPQCFTTVKDYGKKIATTDDDLVRLKGKDKKLTTEDKRRWFQMLEYEKRRLGKSEKWLLANYKTKTGVWPRGMDNLVPLEPDETVRRWLVSQRIRYAKRKQKEEREGAAA